MLTLVIFLLSFSFCFSQDTITVTTGEPIAAKVLEVTPTLIRYKKWDNLKVPVFTIDKTSVSQIRYENGTKNAFTPANTDVAVPIPLSSQDLFTLGNRTQAKQPELP